MNKVFTFLRDVQGELSKVNWPTRSQTIRYTLVVIGLSLFVAVFLGVLDFGFGYFLDVFLLR